MPAKLSFILALILATLATSCSTPVSKREALDLTVITRTPGAGTLLSDPEEDEITLDPTTAWMGVVLTAKSPVFVGYRDPARNDTVRYCLVTLCDPATDKLGLIPLPSGQTPLDFTPAGKANTKGPGSIMVSLSKAIESRRLVSPIPRPKNIYAVAANFPSHLREDLAIDGAHENRELLRRARARVFRKYPPVPPPGLEAPDASSWSGVIGPYDDIVYPANIKLPPDADRAAGTGLGTETRLDYEVEIGVVIGRPISSESIATLSDEDLWNAIAGVVLVSDVKARNPQVILKIARHDSGDEAQSDPHAFGDGTYDEALGVWDRKVCDWWSYASSWGDYAALGPFFVARKNGATSAESMLPRSVITARSYGTPEVRGQLLPPDREAGTFYLRQCSEVTVDDQHPDALIWNVPDIMRSIVATDSVLFPEGSTPRLEPGDVISLGTPGGVVLTARSQWLFNLLSTFLSTWTPLDWHDFFFGDDGHLYLNSGDEVLFWGSGLGYQRHVIRAQEAP